MTEREGDHWSIGEVLALIQEEFPDVTISKIRFLESQGLVSPERTPSGYRRFYRDDFDRLQWILSQQRDHYLPLKVIRDRLESGDLDGENEVTEAPVLPFADATLNSRSKPRTGKPLRKPDPDNPDQAENSDHSSSQTEESSDGELAEVVSIDRAVNKTASERLDSTFAEVARSLGQQDSQRSSTDTSTPAAAAVPLDSAAIASTPGDETPSESAAGASKSTLSQPDQPIDAAVQTTTSDRRSDSVPREGRTERRGRSAPQLGSNSALTKDELAEASGCSLETLLALERFGLLSGRTIGPTVLYDAEALRVAQLAAQFVAYGLEPRHLRAFKIGAEREVSLLSQVVEPMLYRRDEQARAQSLAALDDMVELAANLHAILVQQMVREQLPSQRG